MADPSEESKEYKVGYGNPPLDTRFGAPNGNKPGMTSETRKAVIEAGEKAARLYLEMVSDLEGKIADMKTREDDPDKFAALVAIKADVLKLLRDVQDRAFGAPTQPVDNTSSDGSLRPAVIKINAVKPEGT